MKRLQNKIAESGATLPTVVMVALALQMASSFPTTIGAWTSLLCFALTAYLMVELSNTNALLRIRSRMVTSSFIALSCAGGLMTGSIPPMLTQLSMVGALYILFMTYQDKRAMNKVYFAFLFVSLASITFVKTLLLVPLIWILMATQLQSLNWRTWSASILGLATPYWVMLPWLLYQHDFGLWADHIERLCTFAPPLALGTLTAGQTAIFVFTTVLCTASIIHSLSYSFEDKIRIRLLYGFLSNMAVACMVFLLLQPQHYDTLMRLILVFASPLIAHFLTFTSSRLSNIVFIAVLIVTVGIFVLNAFL